MVGGNDIYQGEERGPRGPASGGGRLLHDADSRVGIQAAIGEDAVLSLAGVVKGDDHRRPARRHVDVAQGQVANVDGVVAVRLELRNVLAELTRGAVKLTLGMPDKVI